jgi:hypothetical protein
MMPKCTRLTLVVTVSVVLAAPLLGVTAAGLKVQVAPVTGEQENATLLVKPPDAATFSMNCVERPAITVAVAGVAEREKSPFAMTIVTGADVLDANFPSVCAANFDSTLGDAGPESGIPSVFTDLGSPVCDCGRINTHGTRPSGK